MNKVRSLVAAGLLGAATVGTMLVAGPASASTVGTAGATPSAHAAVVRPDSGWLGACEPIQLNQWTAGGFCDGNGPDAVYQGWIICTDGHQYLGTLRWAGDQRGSYATCPGTGTVVQHGVTGWLK